MREGYLAEPAVASSLHIYVYALRRWSILSFLFAFLISFYLSIFLSVFLKLKGGEAPQRKGKGEPPKGEGVGILPTGKEWGDSRGGPNREWGNILV